jgi:hypothetical protein
MKKLPVPVSVDEQRRAGCHTALAGKPSEDEFEFEHEYDIGNDCE